MRRFFQASPNGVGSGVVIAEREGHTLTVVVVPKMWSFRPMHHSAEWPQADAHFELTIAEMDTVELTGKREGLLTLDALFGSRDEIAGRRLLVPIARQSIAKDSAMAEDVPDSPDAALRALDALSRVCGLGSILGHLPPVWGTAISTTLFRPLLLRDFVHSVAGNLQRARRGYVWREDRTTAVRGRVDPTSIAVHDATGWPLLKCRFEEFNRDTELLQVVVTALGIAASERAENPVWAAVQKSTADLAISLRRQLADTRDLPRAHASRLAPRVRLGVFDKHWEDTLSLARRLLDPRDGLTTTAPNTSAVELWIDTARAWERVLFEVLSRTAVHDLTDLNAGGQSPLPIERPWTNLGSVGDSPRPDLVLRVRDQWWILDAKYRRLTSGRPDMSDQYQMFAYSHLAQVSPLRCLALVYPTRKAKSRPLGPYVRAIQGDAWLWVQSVRFPTAFDVQCGWSSYLREAAADFQLVAHGD